nr:MAG TPA: hypothetical protein [Caudoviricetes sp.]
MLNPTITRNKLHEFVFIFWSSYNFCKPFKRCKYLLSSIFVVTTC